MHIKDFYVDVIVPLSVKGVFTYSNGKFDSKDLLIGKRVVVEFGSKKLYSAIITKVHYQKPTGYKIKSVFAVFNEKPLVNNIQLKLWDWIANYYCCNLGDVMNAALPSLFKLASESKVIIHPDFDGDISELNEHESNLFSLLTKNEEMTVQSLVRATKAKGILNLVNQLIGKEIIQFKEDIVERYKEKTINIIDTKLKPSDTQDLNLSDKQHIILNTFFSLQKKYPKKQLTPNDILKKTNVSRSVINALIKKNILHINTCAISRLLDDYKLKQADNKLVDFQNDALKKIKNSFKKNNVCLLHGITSSGKTEIYIELIKDQLNKGKQVLYLLPEIALTTQIVKRLRAVFKNKVGITHSHLNNSERVEIWNAVQSIDLTKVNYPIMLGVRSSLFLPFDNLGLIIVDEEHDTSFKQNNPSPRYHARDTAIYLANLHSAKILLGSATPSIESYVNALNNKYSLVNINQRFSNIKPPDIQTIDIRKEKLKKRMQYQFSQFMIDEIQKALDSNNQIILFQNKRGFAPIITCHQCSYTPQCTQCDVSLTVHKFNNCLKCHYCGYTEPIPDACSKCNSQEMNSKGIGTEQIEESLNQLFPDHNIRRMDYDTTRRKNAYQEIINDFEIGSIDILIGTQMITKGLDFDNVSLVGIIDSDHMLNFADFRAYERAFQLMMQVSGRAGRKHKQGKVIIQTHDEANKIFTYLRSNDYIGFIKEQLDDRKSFIYPPYNRLIKITIKHKKKDILDRASNILGNQMKKSFNTRVLGPTYPFVSKIRNYYHQDILLKIEKKASFKKAKDIVKYIISNVNNMQEYRSVRFDIDVDPT